MEEKTELKNLKRQIKILQREKKEDTEFIVKIFNSQQQEKRKNQKLKKEIEDLQTNITNLQRITTEEVDSLKQRLTIASIGLKQLMRVNEVESFEVHLGNPVQILQFR